MKKRIFVVLAAVLLLAGCGSKSKLMKIETKYAPTTGEQIGYKIEDENVVYLLNEQSKETNPNADGSAEVKTYEFAGKTEGETTVTITVSYDGYDNNTVYEVKVDKDLNITYKER